MYTQIVSKQSLVSTETFPASKKTFSNRLKAPSIIRIARSRTLPLLHAQQWPSFTESEMQTPTLGNSCDRSGAAAEATRQWPQVHDFYFCTGEGFSIHATWVSPKSLNSYTLDWKWTFCLMDTLKSNNLARSTYRFWVSVACRYSMYPNCCKRPTPPYLRNMMSWGKWFWDPSILEKDMSLLV